MVNKKIFLFIIIITLVFVSLNFVFAADCWSKTSSTCTAANGCKWKNDSWSLTGWCEELNCWSLYSQSECTTTSVPGKNCTWTAGGTSYGCEKLSCWTLSGTNESSCVNNAAGLNCEWQNYCSPAGGSMPSTNCYQNLDRSSCLNSTGCSWGNCMEKGCWSYYSNTTCNSGKDWNGKNCTWDSSSNYCTENGCWKYNANSSYCINGSAAKGLNCQWKYNSCQDIDCYAWDFTNASTCINNSLNLSCSWTGSYCNKQDCWNYNTQNTCQAKPGCLWKAYVSSGWCNEVNCWSWDSMNGGNQTSCENNNYGLSCLWSGNPAGNLTNGWCYKNIATVGCTNFTTERSCMDTYYCWWQYTDWNNPSAGGICNSPGSFGGGASGISNNSILNEWNPGCYIFDMNYTDCNSTIGCNYSFSTSKCLALDNAYGRNITANGLNCSYINSSSLCNSIPALASCCSWQNGSCSSNKLSTSCRDQMQAPPIGASFCEDYNSYENQQLCEQIAGSPWYMPCTWINATSKCGFKASDVFGNETQSLAKIDNKKNCEAAGGKWIIENYCEGNISIPAGRCEYKFDEEDNCDKACFACELKDSSGNSINSSSAALSACTGSKLGICEFTASTLAPNGFGFCKSKEQFKKGIAGSCDSNCGDCTYKGNSNSNDTTKRPSYYCSSSKANSDAGGCKWITDNSTKTGGYCVNKGEKTCEDSCDRCNSQTNCANIGRTAISNKTGSCKWSGSETTGSCVANIGQDVEICWDGIDNNNDNLIDCSDGGCYADSSCGFVSGDCFGWTNNNTCISKGCEWISDNWGSWCDFKGSQCWKYNQNNSVCNANTNCQWNNGSGTSTSWCEKDMSQQESCMGKTKTSCLALAPNCNWTIDSWCNGTGAGTSWCLNTETAGWCDSPLFKPKDCWKYSSSSSCSAVSGCGWKSDSYSMPHCEVNWSVNCWQNIDSVSCNANTNCVWDIPTYGGGSGWCASKADKCWSYGQADCSSAFDGGRCYWQSWQSTGGTSSGSCQSVCWNGNLTSDSCSSHSSCIWKAESGWCEESAMASCSNSTNTNNQTSCQETSGCRWKTSGWCDPKNGGFSAASNAAGGSGGTSMGGDCYKYDGNISLCTNKSIINISCGWTTNSNPTCDVNWGNDCWRYNSVAGGCNATNNCWYKNETWGGGFCTHIMDQCSNNMSLQGSANVNACRENYLCTNNSWGGCEAKCSSLTASSCTNSTYFGKCKWSSGWCNPGSMTEMFNGMEAGQAAPLGVDNCGENGMQASVDICGFGMRDMGDSYGFGMGVNNFANSSVCNKEKLSSFVMGHIGGSVGGQGFETLDYPSAGGSGFGEERIGNGNDTVIVLVYLDTDGSTTGGCTLSHNSSAVGYEFRFKYTSQWNANTSKAVETFNSDKCEGSSWKATDIKLSVWKKKMCSEIGGPMIAVKKSDLGKYPTLYDSTKDMRISVATIGNTGNVSIPTDSAGPGWTTPGSIDFEIKGAFEYGADNAKFEDILRYGFTKGEDCFNSVDDDSDSDIDCYDWDCQYSSKCSGLGVNAAGYVDTSSPLVTGVKIEEYNDAALVMYDTNKPTNGTLEFYYNDSQCLSLNKSIYDIGVLSANVRDYKLWHTANIYNSGDSSSLTYSLTPGTSYYYKLKVCDANNKCAISKCSSFRTPASAQKCAYCNFVTRIKPPTGWKVAYDVDRNGNYEHVQGEVCGPYAGMKTNYTIGRKVNVKIYSSDGTGYIEFLNASLTKTALNDKVRTLSSSGDIINDGVKVGLTSESRDKIINNLHPEACRVKIPVASGTTCNTLYHCDDNGANCVDRTAAAGGAPIDSVNCVWNVPYCEFSTYKGASASGGSSGSSGGGGGGGGGSSAKTYNASESEIISGYSKELAKNEKIKFSYNSVSHTITLTSVSSSYVNVTLASLTQTIFLNNDAKFDLNSDNKYDISIKYVSYSNNKANIYVKAISQQQASITGNAAQEPSTSPSEKSSEESFTTVEQSNNLIWIIVLIVVIIVGILILLLMLKIHRKHKKYY